MAVSGTESMPSAFVAGLLVLRVSEGLLVYDN